IKEVINAQSESFFGGPAMEFRTSALDQRSGRTITFCWWLTRIGMEIMKPGTEKDRVEVFQDEQEVSFLYNMGTRNFSCPNSEASFNHGVLAVKVTSEKAVDQV
ncbi:MAG: hypothetical protein ACLFO3_07485, partial [Candidatus Acetothermia bacterium]